MHYVYCLESTSRKNELYFGYTTDLRRRFVEHNEGLNISTKRYMPWKLIYYEACVSEIDALRREKYLKTTQGRRMFTRRVQSYMKRLTR